MPGAAFPLLAVPLAWYLLGVAGAAIHPRRHSPLTVFAVIRGAAVLILVTWILTRWMGLPGRVALPAVAAMAAVAIAARVRAGALRAALVPDRRDLPMLALGTVLLSAWIAPVTRHGIGAIGTGNHADLPSYLLQAGYLYDHGFDATGLLPGIAPEDRMFDGFGAYALLAPSTAVSAAPTLGVMALMILGAVLIAQLVDRMAGHVLGGARVAPLLIGATLLLSWAFTFNAFAYFVAQVWGMAFGVGLVAALLARERGAPAALGALLVSVAGALTYNATGAMYAATALILGGWLVAVDAVRGRPALRSPGLPLAAGVAAGAVVFLPVWHQTLDRLWALREAVAGWPMPTAPLWAAVGIPISEQGNSTRAIVAGGVAVAAVAAAGWSYTARTRRLAALTWPLAIPAAIWLYQAAREPGSYKQWKAFSYAQPLLVVAIGCGVVLLASALAGRLPPLRAPRRTAAAGVAVAAALVVCAAAYAFWPRTYFADDGCCIASSDQITQLRRAADASPGHVRVAAGNVWANDVAAAIVSRSRPVSLDPPSIWPSEPVEDVAGTIGFAAGPHPSFAEARFVLSAAAQ